MRPTVFPPGFVPASSLPGTVFPSFPDPARALALTLLAQLADTQWWPADRLAELQLAQLDQLVRHAAATTARGRRLYPAGPLTWDAFRAIPPLTRAEVQSDLRSLQSDACPQAHGRVGTITSSGSTGTPITVYRSELTDVVWVATTARDHVWHGRDTRLPFATIRVARDAPPPHGVSATSWGRAAALVGPPGPSHVLHVTTSTREQLDWLVAREPAYVLTYPSMLRDIVRRMADTGTRLPSLRSVTTMGEVLDPELRAEVADVIGLPIVDMYSTQEVGYLALQCPDNPVYHVQAETVLLEVVRADGTACGPGEVGRVLVTALHNFAMPLVRYELGDLAEVGPPCSCGRQLPTLTRIIGRVRNTWARADGDRQWPTFSSKTLRKLAPIEQHQFVQTAVDRLEARLVVSRPLTPDERGAIEAHLRVAFPPGTDIALRFVATLERGPGGKFEDFQSLV